MELRYYDKNKHECRLCGCLLPDRTEDIINHTCQPEALLARVTEPYKKEEIKEKENNSFSFEWLAGFVDGEGTISVTKRMPQIQNRTYYPTYRSYLSISSTTDGIIEYIKNSLDSIFNRDIGSIGIYELPNIKHKNQHLFSLSKFEDLKIVLIKIYPYLRIKKEQTKLVLDFIESRLKIGIKKHIGSNITKEEIQIYEKLKKLNQKGKEEQMEQENEITVRDIAPTMVGTLEETQRRYKQLQEFIQKQMVENEDYGKIPGCPKPSLFKPGAEKLLELYGYAVSDIQTINRIEDWEKGFFHYEMKAIAISKRSGQIVGTGIGACNSKEKKYITQDPYTIQNTLLKMAKKRAIVDLALLVTRSSALFTQDVEDMDNGVIKKQEPLQPITGTLTIEEALKRKVGETFDVQGILSNTKTETIISKKDKKKHEIVHYTILSNNSQLGMTISKWGNVPEHIKLNDIVIAVLTKRMPDFKGEAKYLCQNIDLVSTAEEEANIPDE